MKRTHNQMNAGELLNENDIIKPIEIIALIKSNAFKPTNQRLNQSIIKLIEKNIDLLSFVNDTGLSIALYAYTVKNKELCVELSKMMLDNFVRCEIAFNVISTCGSTKGITLPWVLAHLGEFELLERAIDYGVNFNLSVSYRTKFNESVDEVFLNNDSIIFEVTRNGQWSLFKKMLKKGITLDYLNEMVFINNEVHSSLLYQAFSQGEYELLHTLIDMGIKTDLTFMHSIHGDLPFFIHLAIAHQWGLVNKILFKDYNYIYLSEHGYQYQSKLFELVQKENKSDVAMSNIQLLKSKANTVFPSELVDPTHPCFLQRKEILNTALRWAVRFNLENEIVDLLSLGAAKDLVILSPISPEPQPLIVHCAHAKNWDIVKTLADSGICPLMDTTNPDKLSTIQLALYAEQFDLVDRWIAQSQNHEKALDNIITLKRFNQLDLFLDLGLSNASVNFKFNNIINRVPLIFALASLSKWDLVRKCVDKGSDSFQFVNMNGTFSTTMMVLYNAQKINLIRHILYVQPNKVTALHYAAVFGLNDVVNTLLDLVQAIPENVVSDYRWISMFTNVQVNRLTPNLPLVVRLARNKQWDMLHKAMGKAANLFESSLVPSGYFESVLSNIIRSKRWKTLKVFLSLSLNIPELNNLQRSLMTMYPIMACAYHKKWDYVDKMVERGANPNVISLSDPFEVNLLWFAAQQNEMLRVQAYLEYGLDPNVSSKSVGRHSSFRFKTVLHFLFEQLINQFMAEPNATKVKTKKQLKRESGVNLLAPLELFIKALINAALINSPYTKQYSQGNAPKDLLEIIIASSPIYQRVSALSIPDDIVINILTCVFIEKVKCMLPLINYNLLKTENKDHTVWFFRRLVSALLTTVSCNQDQRILVLSQTMQVNADKLAANKLYSLIYSKYTELKKGDVVGRVTFRLAHHRKESQNDFVETINELAPAPNVAAPLASIRTLLFRPGSKQLILQRVNQVLEQQPDALLNKAFFKQVLKFV